MFESLALEDPRNRRRRWTTAASLALEALAVGILILAPLGYTEAISLRVDKPLVVPSGRPTAIETHARPDRRSEPKPQTAIREARLIYGGKIPNQTTTVVDPLAAPASENVAPYVPNSTGPTTYEPALHELYISNNRPNPAGPSLPHHTLTVSHLDPGMLIKQVQPIYPRIAVLGRIEGTVLLAAVIDTRGRITQLRALGGPPLLIAAAIDAVQQWRYKPYILNGEPTEVETQVSVVFTLQR